MRTTRFVAGAAVAAALLIPPPAGAEEFPSSSLVLQGGEIPADLAASFADCPRAEDMPPGFFYYYCVKVTAYDGVLKIGSVEAAIDEPLEILAGIGANIGTGEIAIVPAEGSGGGGFQPVSIPGGILGVPELAPLIDLDPLGLLSLSVTPTIGDIGAEPSDLQPTHLPEITLPLSLQLNNTLFGDDCRIASPAEPITIELLTSAPGGNPPVQSPQLQWTNYDVPGGPTYRTGTGARSVANNFAVPGVECPGVGGLGDSLGSLLSAVGLGDGALGSRWFANPFELLINNVAGLPSPAGQNYMAISVDTAWVTPGVLAVLDTSAKPKATFDPGPVLFGDVEVGSSATETVTVTNPGTTPTVLDLGAAISDDTGGGGVTSVFEIVDNGCAGLTLDPGEACEIEVRFTPAGPGFNQGTGWLQQPDAFWFPEFGAFGGLSFTVAGTGVAPGSTPDPDPEPPAPVPPAPSGPNCLLGLGLDLGILCL